MDKLIALLLTAVATVLATATVIAVVKRVLQIKLFRSRCELAFSKAILQDEGISKDSKQFWQDLYENAKPSNIKLFCSKKPMTIDAWFTSEEIDGFFIPACKFNNPAKEARTNNSVLNYKKYA